MRSPASTAVLGGLVIGLAAVCACSSGGGGKPTGAAGHDASGMAGLGGGGGGGGQSAAGTNGAAGDGTAGASDGGDAGTADASDTIDGGDAAMSDATDPTDAAAIDATDASETRDAREIDGAIVRVVPTIGCGIDPGQAGGTVYPYTIATSGTKPANCVDKVCGPWMYTREYYLTLPIGYDNTKAYPLVFEGPGCGGKGSNTYSLNSLNNVLPENNNVDNTIIHVGLTPPPNDIGAATRPGQGCFDYAEGENSVDWAFYEALYDHLAGLLCFDKNRVFVLGEESGGSWFANELACKYAGDARRPIRGMMSNSGGLPNAEVPVLPCNDNPMAGMWVEQTGDTIAPFTQVKFAVTRAMKVNGCTLGTNYDDATFENFPIGVEATLGPVCKKVKGCPDLTPVVVCPLFGNSHSTNPTVANPGFATFIKLFETPPLLTP